jgi:preprotein translocase YajC subunit
MSTLLLLLLFVLAWVVLILPKQRELKRHNALVASLDVGDEVMSGAGMYGTITGIEGDVVWLEIAPDLEIKLAKRAIASKVAAAEVDEDDDDDPTDDDPTDDDPTDDDPTDDDPTDDDPTDDDPTDSHGDGDQADDETTDDGVDPADRVTDVEDLIIGPDEGDRPGGRP